jgi:hypothetical protein
MAEGAAAAAVLFFLFSTKGPIQGHAFPFQGKAFLFRGNTGFFEATIIERKVVRYKIIIFYCS